ncbi:MAG: hypothetical protein HOP19_15120, partial [Acidobacteria bacterium]|nr:hypothetical protein [Acidobacteriota bacterium]
MTEIATTTNHRAARALSGAGNCLCLILFFWLAALPGSAQTGSSALTGEKGHTIIQPPSRPLAKVATASEAPAPAKMNLAALLQTASAFPAFSIQQPAGFGKTATESKRAYPFLAFTLKAPGFTIQQPADLATQSKNATPPAQQTGAAESSERVQQLLNDGYQALN